MEHIVSINEFFNYQENSKLLEYYKNIPEKVFTCLESVNIESLINYPDRRKYSDLDILNHQLFYIQHSGNIYEAIRIEDLLERNGYDTISLSNTNKYYEISSNLNESLLSKVGEFFKKIVADDDPVEQALNVIRLVLDLIGIVPFTWVGFPIDMVANFISALISIYKGEYFVACLSIAAMVDVTRATNLLKNTLGPIAKVLNPVLKVLFRGKPAEIGKLSAEILKLKNPGLLKIVSGIFKDISHFFLNGAVSILKLVTRFIDYVLKKIPVFGKHIGKLTSLVDGISAHLVKSGGEFAKASKMLLDPETAKLTGTKIASVDKKFATLGKKNIESLTNLVKSDSKFMKSLENIPVGKRDAYVMAKVENELLGKSNIVVNNIMKDPALAKHLATTYGWIPGKDYLATITKSGNASEVKKFFDIFLGDSTISAKLTTAERNLLSPFRARPDVFIEGVKHFDECIDMLRGIEKLGGKFSLRHKPLVQIINLLTRLLWQRYGSVNCMIQAGISKAKDSVAELTSSFGNIKTEPVASTLNEDDTTELVETPLPSTSDTPDDFVMSASEKNKEAIATQSKNDCGRIALEIKAVAGQVTPQFPGSTAELGGDFNLANDPEKAMEFQKKSAEYSAQILNAMGLDPNIEVQHALEYNDPVVKAYFADVWNSETNTIELNTLDKSRVDDVINSMIKDGTITKEQAPDIKAEVERRISNDDPPEIKIPAYTNESIFQTKSFSFIK